MKFSLKSIAAAVALAAVASTSFAAIDNGSNGNGELFFNIWDASGSYSRDLNVAIDSYSAATSLTFLADNAFTSFLSGVTNTSALKWNIVAVDTMGAQRLLSTVAGTVPATGSKNSNLRSADGNVAAQATSINAALLAAGATDSIAVGSSSAAWAGKATFGANPGALLNFTNAGTLANNSFTNGLSFIQVDALATGIAASKYTTFTSKAWIGNDGSINIAAAVPEPENYAMLLAGLGMIGFMARGKKRA